MPAASLDTIPLPFAGNVCTRNDLNRQAPMFGQGRPQRSSRAAPVRRRRAFLWLVACVLALAAMTTANAVAAEIALKLRISWGGGAERAWRGSISATQGSFSELGLLGIEADAARAVWLEGANTLRINPPGARTYDGADLWLRGDSESQLAVELQSAESPTPLSVSVPLSEILSGGHTSVLDDTGNRLSIVRAPGDQLRVHFARPHLVFAPGEPLEFEVEPYEVGQSTDGMQLQTEIMAFPGEKIVASQDQALAAGKTALKLVAPEAEGVYNLRLSVAPPSRIKQRLRLTQPVVERTVQIVVLAPKAPVATGDPLTTKVVEINPVNSRWWERLTSLPTIPGFRKGPLGNGDAAPWEHPTLGPFIQLGPGGDSPNVSWEAYPLPIHQTGAVHVLEVEYPSDVPQTLGISILEPNAAGEVAPIGLDSGLFVTDEDASATPRLQKHRIVFWPRTKTPLVLFTNRRTGSRAVYGKITVSSAAGNQLAMLAIGRGASSGLLPPAFDKSAAPQRLWAGYMDRPLVPENFGAPESLDTPTGRSLDDWNTFYQAGTRLVSYLQHVGYNGLMLSVMADGSTIYPSQLAGSTPRYDTGVFFSSGQDLQRKDALELVFRLFDREGLALVPALQFAAPLPELETLRRSAGAVADGVEWIGPDGRALSATAVRQGLAPYYNVLDPRVQDAMLRVVREVSQRYAQHASFRGIALQISPEGFAQLPGDQYGMDDATIARFEQAARLKVPGEGPQRFSTRARYLMGPGRAAWAGWRSRTVTEFHQRLEQEIAFARPGARLFLADGTLLEGGETRRQLRPSLVHRADLAETFKAAGVNVPAYVPENGIVALRPHVVRPEFAGVRLGVESATNGSRELDELFATTNQRGAIFHHEPQKVRVASFDAKSPFGPSNTYTWLASQISPAGDQNRRRFVQALAASDLNQVFDGGWTLPLGQEASLRSLLSIYRQLPDGAFESVPVESQPITIRTRSQDGATYVYLVNDSPWPATVSLTLQAPGDCELANLGEGNSAGTLQRGMNQLVWAVQVGAYDLVGAKFSSPQVRVQGANVELPEGVRETLENQIQDLVARVRTSGQSLVSNPGFELPLAQGQLAGWTAEVPMGGRVLLDSRIMHSGAQSLMLEGTGTPVGVKSTLLTPQPAGRAVIEVWLRAIPVEGKLPAVRIAMQGTSVAGPFASQGVVQNVGATANKSGDWVPYSYSIENLPQDGLSDVAVKFELLGPGQVWIDDVQVRGFSEKELAELAKINSMAHLHLEKGRYADCARLLDSYWPQFLVSNVPLTSTNTPVARRPKPVEPEAPVEPAKSPSLFETMKGYLPPMFR